MSNTPQWPPSGDPNVPSQWGANGSGGMPPQQPNSGWQQDPNLPGWQQQPYGQQPYGQQYGQQPGQQYGQQPYGAVPTPPQAENKGLGAKGIALIVGAVALVLIVGMVGLGVVLFLNRQEPPSHTVAAPTVNTESSESTPTDPTQETTTDPTDQPTQTQAGSPDEANKPPALPSWLPKKDWKAIPPSTAKTDGDRTLMENWIYGYNMPIPKGCPALKPKPSAAEYKAIAPKLLDCLSNAWAPLFEHAGKKYEKPVLVFFKDTPEGPCMKEGDKLSSNYCPDNNTLYIYEPDVDSVKNDEDLPYSKIYEDFIFHVQFHAGIYGEAGAKSRDIDESVGRLLLQNDCVKARQMLFTDSGEFTHDKFKEFLVRQGESAKRRELDPENAAFWGWRGFYMERVGGCNTWTLPSAEVK